MQEELSHLSASETRIVAKGGGHYIQNDWPDVVIQAVHEMVEQRAPVSRSPHSRSTRH
jgi:hypothetical protein